MLRMWQLTKTVHVLMVNNGKMMHESLENDKHDGKRRKTRIYFRT